MARFNTVAEQVESLAVAYRIYHFTPEATDTPGEKGLLAEVEIYERVVGYPPSCNDFSVSEILCVSREGLYTERSDGRGGYWLFYAVGYRHAGYRRRDDRHD